MPKITYITHDNKSIVDLKWGKKYMKSGQIHLYNTETDKLSSLSNDDLSNLIHVTQPPYRHWIQGYRDSQIVVFITDKIPSLKYLFP